VRTQQQTTQIAFDGKGLAKEGSNAINIDALFSLQRNRTDIGTGLRDDECEFVLAKTM